MREIVVFTNGCFDILHVGHVDRLRRAKELGTKLVVGINSDASVRSLKGKSRPLVSETDRAEMLRGLRPVDEHVMIGCLDLIAKSIEKETWNGLG